MSSRTGTSQFHSELELHQKITAIVEDIFASRKNMWFGEVVEYDAEHHAVRVELMPRMGHQIPYDGAHNAVTEFIQLTAPWVGNGWGLKGGAIPHRAHVIVVRLGYPLGVHFAIGPFYNSTNKPPEAESGEVVVTHKTGTRVKLTNDGGAEITQPSTGSQVRLEEGGDIVLDSAQKVVIHCDDVRLVSDGATEAAMLGTTFQRIFEAHVHEGVMTGGGQTQAPKMPGASVTPALSVNVKLK